MGHACGCDLALLVLVLHQLDQHPVGEIVGVFQDGRLVLIGDAQGLLGFDTLQQLLFHVEDRTGQIGNGHIAFAFQMLFYLDAHDFQLLKKQPPVAAGTASAGTRSGSGATRARSCSAPGTASATHSGIAVFCSSRSGSGPSRAFAGSSLTRARSTPSRPLARTRPCGSRSGSGATRAFAGFPITGA